MNYQTLPRNPVCFEALVAQSGWAVGLRLGYLFAGSSNGEEKRTVKVRRRRRSEPAESGDRKQAEAPRRRKTQEPSSPASGGSARPPSQPTTSFGGGQMPSGRSLLLLIGVVVVLAVCVLPLMILFGGGDSGSEDDGEIVLSPSRTPAVIVEDEGEPAPSSTPRPIVPPSTNTEGQTWLVMLYQDADDKILEQDIYVDLNEAERVGSTDRVQIVAQVDRYREGYQGDGNWTSARRFYVTHDNDLSRVGSEQLADLGEVDMADGETLVDFVTWAVDSFPADRHVLIMSDHGMGWPGGWSDPAPGGRSGGSTPLESALSDQLFLMELDEALGEIRAQTGLDQFELVGLDACLMGHLEVYSALAEHARYAAASQETEPAVGWAYASFLSALAADPDMDGTELGRQIVDSYIREDERIVDDQARAEFLSRGSPMGGLFGMLGGSGMMSAQQLAQQMGRDVTIAAIDLGALSPLMTAFNDFSYALQDAPQREVAQARNYAQAFTSIFGSDIPPSYIDLGHFAQLLRQESGDRAIGAAVDDLLAALGQAIIAEKHGSGKPGATGLSIYFPNSQLYRSPVTGPESYTAIARRFADESLWDDFLAFHYTGQTFEPSATGLAVPSRGTTVVAPGAGEITLSPLTLSDATAGPGLPVIMTADVSGDNIGYIYLFAGYVDQAANSIYVADSDYLESADTREIAGVYYPDWGEGDFTLEFEWEPIVFAISDGVNTVQAQLTPESYGASFEDAVYTVEGIYTYADGGESRYARLYFRDGVLQQVFGFSEENGTGAPREITPSTGDSFTVLEKWLDLDSQGRVTGTARQEGGTLVFGDQMFAWEELDAAPGQYVIGFIVEDLDGNINESYAAVIVE